MKLKTELKKLSYQRKQLASGKKKYLVLQS